MTFTSPMITPRYAEDARHLAELSPRELDRELQACDVAYLRRLARHLRLPERVTGGAVLAEIYKTIVTMRVEVLR